MPGESDSVHWLEQLLWSSRVMAFARFSPDGSLKQANDRFLSLFKGSAQDRRLQDLVTRGQRDDIVSLLRGREPCDTPRNFNFAQGDQAPTTLLVSWRWEEGDLLMLGEAPVADLEASQEMLVKLNSRVSELMRENTKKSAELERTLAELGRSNKVLAHTVEDLRNSHWHLRRVQELLPICSYCGKVRTEDAYWQSVQEYLQENSDFLTHSICPECLEKVSMKLEDGDERVEP